MFKMRRICHLIFRLLFLLDGGVWSLRNLSISVPRGVLSGEGRSAVLRCEYDLEGAALYSIRWYRDDTEFYRFVPRELPPTMVFPLPGASVDLTQSDAHQVRIVNLHRRLSGEYQCEVTADAPLFHNEIRAAPLTVVDPPFRAPHLWVSVGGYSRGDVIVANCSVDPAYPKPNISWYIDEVKVAESISWRKPEDFRERGATSRLVLTVLDGSLDQYERSFDQSVDRSGYQSSHSSGQMLDDIDHQEVLRVSHRAPPSGQLSVRCAAAIFDVYSRPSVAASLRELAPPPRPASVTRDDASGSMCLQPAAALGWSAALLLMTS